MNEIDATITISERKEKLMKYWTFILLGAILLVLIGIFFWVWQYGAALSMHPCEVCAETKGYTCQCFSYDLKSYAIFEPSEVANSTNSTLSTPK